MRQRLRQVFALLVAVGIFVAYVTEHWAAIAIGVASLVLYLADDWRGRGKDDSAKPSE